MMSIVRICRANPPLAVIDASADSSFDKGPNRDRPTHDVRGPSKERHESCLDYRQFQEIGAGDRDRTYDLRITN